MAIEVTSVPEPATKASTSIVATTTTIVEATRATTLAGLDSEVIL
jgi:hypothetical protein